MLDIFFNCEIEKAVIVLYKRAFNKSKLRKLRWSLRLNELKERRSMISYGRGFQK